MKELSIEQKAKAYDEALERAKSKLHYPDRPCFVNVTEIFPELKDSEDEKIRKTLYGWVCTEPDDTFKEGFTKEQILAWLEKQGKQKTYGQRKECVDCQFNYAGECKGSCAMKRDEQKPATWSEEDETGLTNTIIMLKEGASLHFNKKDITKAIDWLKSLKEIVQPQPKQEWTMQDEEELQIALDTLVKAGQHSSAKWLKNVCMVPQNTWKPNDKQMEVLWKYSV